MHGNGPAIAVHFLLVQTTKSIVPSPHPNVGFESQPIWRPYRAWLVLVGPRPRRQLWTSEGTGSVWTATHCSPVNISVSTNPHDVRTCYVWPARPWPTTIVRRTIPTWSNIKWERWTDCLSVPCQARVLTRALRWCAHNYGAGESWAYLGDLYPRLLSLFSSCDKDDEAVDFGHSVAPSARFW